MKYIYMSIYLGMFISNLIFCFYSKYLLVMLMMLEFMVLNIFFLFNFYLFFNSLTFFFLMIFLIITVCEGVMGVAIMVNMFRMYGMDYFCVFNFLV
uniref:NADH dehydrogenase subunit 4L n=1 Tax=Triaenodes qinglingensis TaxID=2904906 RepID=A0A9E8RSP8_9NEOP|nr:NADH dehydrogenase subunit 4L [Triaenodes qinglingensis]UZZ44438.1 NADH dehydrogenase subunit 4L [Triaenodes qinglingensis]